MHPNSAFLRQVLRPERGYLFSRPIMGNSGGKESTDAETHEGVGYLSRRSAAAGIATGSTHISASEAKDRIMGSMKKLQEKLGKVVQKRKREHDRRGENH